MMNLDYLKQQNCWRDVYAAMLAANRGQLSRTKAQALLDAYFALIEGARCEMHPATPTHGI